MVDLSEPLKIVVMDGYTLNPGDLSWEVLERLGPCTIHDRTEPSLVMERARDAEVLLTNKVILGAAAIRSLPRLRYIGVLATGYNVVDVAAAGERRIVVTNVPEYGTASVAQMTFSLLLELASGVGVHWEAVKRGRWSSSPDFSFHDQPQVELSGLTLGIVGFGRIGRAVAKLASGFGMDVLVQTKTPRCGDGMSYVDLDSLFRTSDVVSLHCPLTRETEGMVSQRRLNLMKPSAFLINTARGPLVDEDALAKTLNAGGIAGAALDVLSTEPPTEDNPLFSTVNCIITPHIAWATLAARKRLMELAVGNLTAWMNGQPINTVG